MRHPNLRTDAVEPISDPALDGNRREKTPGRHRGTADGRNHTTESQKKESHTDHVERRKKQEDQKQETPAVGAAWAEEKARKKNRKLEEWALPSRRRPRPPTRVEYEARDRHGIKTPPSLSSQTDLAANKPTLRS